MILEGRLLGQFTLRHSSFPASFASSNDPTKSSRCHADQTADFSEFANQANPQLFSRLSSFVSTGRRAVAVAMPIIMPQFGIHPMSHRTLLPGRSYRFLYPSINFKCLIMCGLQERRILVERIRDTESEPLVEETVNSNPFIKRGRWLVTGIDLDKLEERSFYVESMIAVMEIGGSQISNQGSLRFSIH